MFTLVTTYRYLKRTYNEMEEHLELVQVMMVQVHTKKPAM